MVKEEAFNPKNVDVDKAEFQVFDTWFVKQLQVQYQRK